MRGKSFKKLRVEVYETVQQYHRIILKIPEFITQTEIMFTSKLNSLIIAEYFYLLYVKILG